jgi:hypothetical protein
MKIKFLLLFVLFYSPTIMGGWAQDNQDINESSGSQRLMRQSLPNRHDATQDREENINPHVYDQPLSLNQNYIPRHAIQDLLETEKNTRYMETIVLMIQGTISVGLSLYLATEVGPEYLWTLRDFLAYGTVATSISVSARWYNWFHYVNPFKDTPLLQQRDPFNLKKLDILSNLSQLITYLIPASITSHKISQSLFSGVLAMTGALTAWTLFNINSYFVE